MSTSTKDLARQRQLVDAFLAASREGDFDALLSLLDSEVVLRADRTFLGRAAAAEPALVDGSPGAVWAPGGKPRGVFVFTCRDGKIVEVDVIADPRRIRALDLVF